MTIIGHTISTQQQIINAAAHSNYDDVPYPSYPFRQTHPDNLAAIATLLGMDPPPVERCRVLELGCASGGNLIPMAQGLPDGRFVGIDLSARQIAGGQSMVAALGLKNIILKRMDILDVEAGLGQFDYIIAHGVYSWVPPAIQTKILEICRQNLAPNGVAYVSYNTYPGWRLDNIIREMMLYHTRHITDPQERTTKAKELLDFVAGSKLDGNNAHAGFLQAYINYVKERFLNRSDNDIYLLHNELAEINEPLYFYQFAERAANHGLQYLGEAQFQTMLASNLPAELSQELRRMARNTIAVEQYMDFLRNRPFRQTLLCRAEIQLRSKLTLDRLARFYVASPALPEKPNLDIDSTSVEKFCTSKGTTLATDHPVTKAAMLYLTEVWPQAVSFNALLARARARVNGATRPEATDAEILGANLIKAYGYSDNLVELSTCPSRFTLEVSERPEADPLARLQAQDGTLVTNRRHELVKLDSAHRLLPFLDGSRDRAALLAVMEKNGIELEPNESSAAEEEGDFSNPAGQLESALQSLAKAALLVGSADPNLPAEAASTPPIRGCGNPLRFKNWIY